MICSAASQKAGCIIWDAMSSTGRSPTDVARFAALRGGGRLVYRLDVSLQAPCPRR
jgi:hypothetical protein